jgi:hypothetical protein
LELYLQLTIKDEHDRPPPEYFDFLFCREFGLKPKELDEMDSTTVSLWSNFLNAEAEAGKLRDMQSSHGG